MTVRELYNWCKAYPHKDARVYAVKDWEEMDENGMLTDLYELEDIVDQTSVVDLGLDFEEVTEVLLDFSTVHA